MKLSTRPFMVEIKNRKRATSPAMASSFTRRDDWLDPICPDALRQRDVHEGLTVAPAQSQVLREAEKVFHGLRGTGQTAPAESEQTTAGRRGQLHARRVAVRELDPEPPQGVPNKGGLIAANRVTASPSAVKSRLFIRSPHRREREKDSAMGMPSAFAVLKFTTSSNLLGCCTGRSPGLTPSLRILSTKDAAFRYMRGRFSP